MRRTCFAMLLLTPLLAPAEDAPASGGCRGGETFALAPLEPLALTPAAAREEEERVRHVLGELSGVCLQPRARSAAQLRGLEHHRVPACPDAACRAKLVRGFEAQWLIGGTAYGLGGGRTVNLFLWSADGAVVQRASFTGPSAVEPVARMIREARLGRSLVEGESRTVRARRSRWPELALGGAAVTALAVGGGLGNASARTERQLSSGATRCGGVGDDLQRCLEGEVRRGEGQARAANLLFGAAAVLGAAAAVSFVVEWP